ncbi:WxL protein host-binding domain-containing protein [Enterococcus faecalis]|uniref:WxL protein host-binding domain-containing protein n=1 Tax=Enterococcus faecalis TaxID=1351 RepID=UPI003D0B9D8C
MIKKDTKAYLRSEQRTVGFAPNSTFDFTTGWGTDISPGKYTYFLDIAKVKSFLC